MDARRWQQVSAIFRAALEREAGDRAAYLDAACRDDADLRAEVSSLLEAHEGAGTIVGAPAVEAGGRMLAEGDGLEAGEELGAYRVLGPLGAGGMGAVYLAEDRRLGRRVALKVLPAGLAADRERARRFEQEARAASSLNHPNILTVFEFGREGGRYYLAAEYVEGRTLRRLLDEAGGLGAAEAVEVAAQVAEALGAAHAAGVVHRDVKPENVIVRPDGYVKVLDFGLAKLTERLKGNGWGEATDAEAPTRALVQTTPGMVMGTVSYMSPEQARGEETDARTDVWSMGVVLYEMLTGRTPFPGKTAGHTIVAIQDEEPPPLTDFVPDAPEALQEVVSDALSKDREARPSAKQMLARLERLRRRLDGGAHPDHSTAPNASAHDSEAPFGAAGSAARVAAAPSAGGGTTSSGAPAATTTSAPAATDPSVAARGRRGRLAVLGAVLATALAAGGFAVYKFTRREAPKGPAGQLKFRRLTSTGQASNALISPDGKFVVHIKREDGRSGLWLRQVETTSDTQILAPTDDYLAVVGFSRDGAYVYFIRAAPATTRFTLYQMPLVGGTPRKVADNVFSAVSFSPDGRRMAFRRIDLTSRDSTLVIANADGTGERTLAARKQPNGFGLIGSWSPDGKAVASAVSNAVAGNRYSTLVEVDVESGAERSLTPERWALVGSVVWLPDRSGLIVSATAEGTSESQIWHVSYPEGAVRRVTNDLNSYSGVSLTADASALVTVQTEGERNIWVGPAGDAARARQITSDRTLSGGRGISWTPDGRIVYTRQEGGSTDIWVMNADGTDARQLTSQSRTNERPSVTPDGRYIVFRSNRSGTWDIWRMDLDGGNAKQLTRGGTDNYPRPSPDGRWVVFSSTRAGATGLWKVSIDGGEPVRLTEKNTFNPSVSPDGRLIACHYQESPNTPLKAALIPFEGGDPVRVLDLSPKFVGFPGLKWTPDGRALLYAETQGGVDNIWSLPVDGGKPVRLTDFKMEGIYYFAFSRDGKQLAASRGDIKSDVVLITDFR